jgi:hypothetical protein
MNNYEEIKSLINASKKALKLNLTESEKEKIKLNYGLLNEDFDVDQLEKEREFETANSEDGKNKVKKSDKKQAYRVSGGLIVIHGKDEKELQLTTDDKKAFQESMDEFIIDVSELVDFGKLNLYKDNVEWNGKISEMDIEFFFTIKEKNGVYINGVMTQIDEEYLGFLTSLKKFYEKFKSKWSKVIASRKKTPVE